MQLRNAHGDVRAALQSVLARGDDPNVIIPGAGVNALHLSCYYAMGAEMTALLIAAGADPYLCPGGMRSPACMAAEQGSWVELEVMLKTCDPIAHRGMCTNYSPNTPVPLCEYLACASLASCVSECVAGELKCQRCIHDAACVPHPPTADFFKILEVIFSIPGWTPTPALCASLDSSPSTGIKQALKGRLRELVELRLGGSSSRGVGAFGGSVAAPEPADAVISKQPAPAAPTPTPTAVATATPSAATAEDFSFSVAVAPGAASPTAPFSPGTLFTVHVAGAETAIGHRLASMTVGGVASRR